MTVPLAIIEYVTLAALGLHGVLMWWRTAWIRRTIVPDLEAWAEEKANEGLQALAEAQLDAAEGWNGNDPVQDGAAGGDASGQARFERRVLADALEDHPLMMALEAARPELAEYVRERPDRLIRMWDRYGPQLEQLLSRNLNTTSTAKRGPPKL